MPTSAIEEDLVTEVVHSRRAHVPSILAGLATFAWFGWLAVGRWNAGLSTSYDLGIFAQSADSYAHGRLPHSDIRGLDLLGDHFSPILALNAVPWALWSDPRVLLLTQAMLLGCAVAGVVAFARAHGLRHLWLLLALLLLARGVVEAALFDVHEVMWAAPAIVVLVWAVAGRRAGWAFAAAIALVLTKEDLGATVVAAGAAWWLLERRDRPGVPDRRIPLGLAATGVAGIVVAFVVMALVKGGSSSYLGYFGGDRAGLPHQDAVPLWHRFVPLLLFVVSCGVVGLRSPLALIAAPTLLWRVASSSTHYWSIDFHYDLVPTLVGVMAALDVLGASRPRGHRWWVVLSACASIAFGATGIASRAAAPQDSFIEQPRVHAIRDLMGHVPAGARVVAGNDVGAYLVPRWDVAALTVERPESGEWLIFGTARKWRSVYPQCARLAIVKAGPQVWEHDGIVLVHRTTAKPLPTPACTDPKVTR